MSEIFFAPSVVLPIAAGATAGLLSFAAGGVTILSGLALVGVLGGLGWMATRAIFLVEKITEQTLKEMRQKERDVQEEQLNLLMRKLRTDRDHRNDDYLIMLRTLYNEFEETAGQPGMILRSGEVTQQVKQLFSAAVMQLERSHTLWELSERLAGEESQNVLSEREKVLSEVKATVDHLRSATELYKSLAQKEQQVDLTQLRDELDMSLRIAKRTEERMREFDTKPDYERFAKE